MDAAASVTIFMVVAWDLSNVALTRFIHTTDQYLIGFDQTSPDGAASCPGWSYHKIRQESPETAIVRPMSH